MLNPADDRLARMLPEGVLRPVRPADLEEPRGRWRGQAGLVAAPRTTEEVAAIIRACAHARVAVVPRGGGTGLVGGQLMPDPAHAPDAAPNPNPAPAHAPAPDRAAIPAPLVLSLERMTALRGIWPVENVLVAEAGMTLQAVRAAASAEGREFPLALASQGSAMIGGCLSTNAGGVAALRHGTARALCLGIEAVLPDGRILRDLRRLRKDNTGYDLRDLLIGAEGTLGIITAASLRLVVPPAATGLALIEVASPAAALDLLALAERQMAGCVTAFELIARQSLLFLAEVAPELRQPLPGAPAWSVLVEVGLPGGIDPAEALAELCGQGVEAGIAGHGVIARSGREVAEMWALRERIPEANRRIGAIASHDISLPLSQIGPFLDEAGQALGRLAPGLRVNCFGHLGDGNLHYNLFAPPGRRAADYAPLRDALSDCIHGIVVARGGSFSAEHGIGRLKVGALERWGDPVRLAAMRAVKAALDPGGIMNPGAVLAAPRG